MLVNKDKRNEADKKRRWHPEDISEDYITKLKTSAKTVFGDSMTNKMFSSDPKNLTKWLQLFKSAIEDEEIWLQFLEVVDFIIKWAYIKSNETTNTTFLKELFTYLGDLVDFCIQKSYQFMEAEGTILWLWLIEKISINNMLKDKIKDILIKIGTLTVFVPK